MRSPRLPWKRLPAPEHPAAFLCQDHHACRVEVHARPAACADPNSRYHTRACCSPRIAEGRHPAEDLQLRQRDKHLNQLTLAPPRKYMHAQQLDAHGHTQILVQGTYQVYMRRFRGRVLVPAVDRGQALPAQTQEKQDRAHENRDAIERRNLEAAQSLPTSALVPRARPLPRPQQRTAQERATHHVGAVRPFLYV
jgi:hypothetical protein